MFGAMTHLYELETEFVLEKLWFHDMHHILHIEIYCITTYLHMSSSCPGSDAPSEAKSAPVHPITEPLVYASHTTCAAWTEASYRLTVH